MVECQLNSRFRIAFSHRFFAAEANTATLIDTDALDPHSFAFFADVFHFLYAEVSKLTDVNKAVFARQYFYERAEFTNVANGTVVDLASLSNPDLLATSRELGPGNDEDPEQSDEETSEFVVLDAEVTPREDA